VIEQVPVDLHPDGVIQRLADLPGLVARLVTPLVGDAATKRRAR
jgi:hypothetical protein